MTPTTPSAESNRIAALQWGSFVVALLASQIAIGVAAILLANSDPTVAVVPGYHQKAMLWDKSVELREQSHKLGWTVALRVLPGLKSSHVRWQVCDRAGVELTHLRGDVMLYHHTRANQPMRFRIEDKPDGIDVDRAGLWELEMTLESANSAIKFFDSQSVDVHFANDGTT